MKHLSVQLFMLFQAPKRKLLNFTIARILEMELEVEQAADLEAKTEHDFAQLTGKTDTENWKSKNFLLFLSPLYETK